MKNANDLKKIIKDYLNDNPNVTVDNDTEYNNLKEALFYLQSNPSEKFIKSEVERIVKRILSIDTKENLDEWCRCNPAINGKNDKQIKSSFLTHMGVPKLKKQLKTYNYILND